MLKKLKDKPLRGAAILSSLISLVKLSAYVYSGSLIVLWSLLDSIGDSVISAVNYRMERVSQEDADRQHPFGHGGYEVVSSLIQGIVITASAAFVAISGIERLADNARHTQYAIEAAVVMFVSSILGLLIASYLKVAHEGRNRDKSLSHETDEAHYLADFWVNFLSGLGLLGVHYLRLTWIDSVLAVAAALLAVRHVLPIFRRGYESIVQKELPVDIQQSVVNRILSTDEMVKGVHRLRSRQHGSSRYIDFHLVLPKDITLSKAHDISDKVEENIKNLHPGIDVLIHIDPEDHMSEWDWEPSYQT